MPSNRFGQKIVMNACKRRRKCSLPLMPSAIGKRSMKKQRGDDLFLYKIKRTSAMA